MVRTRRTLTLTALALAATLLLAGCYPDAAWQSGWWGGSGEPDKAGNVTVHEGGNMADHCVLDLAYTQNAGVVTMVAPAFAPPAGAIAVVVSWTVGGSQSGTSLAACLNSFHDQVQGDLQAKAIIQACYVSGVSPTDCAVSVLVYEYQRTLHSELLALNMARSIF